MKKLCALLLALSSLSAQAEFFTGNDLLTRMTQPNSNGMQEIGLGYVMGVFDTGHGINHCPPPQVTAGQVYDMVKEMLVATPALRHKSADNFVAYILKKTWPCQPEKPAGASM